MGSRDFSKFAQPLNRYVQGHRKSGGVLNRISRGERGFSRSRIELPSVEESRELFANVAPQHIRGYCLFPTPLIDHTKNRPLIMTAQAEIAACTKAIKPQKVNPELCP